MDCTGVERTIHAWLRDPESSGRELEDCAKHIASCPACRAKHGKLLPLLQRDSGILPALPEAEVVDAVMERIGRERPSRAPSAATRFLRLAIPLAAAAALAVALFLSRPAQGNLARVTFRLYAPQAASVGIAADFNGWSPAGYELEPADGAGHWEITVPLERGKMYLYNFVLDGQTWIPDPGSELIMDDGFGSKSSALAI